MKKIFIPAFAIVLVSLTSCQKNRTCTCDETRTTNGVGTAGTRTETVGHTTKKEAKRMTDCYSYTQTETNTIFGTVYTTEVKVDCKLK